MKVNSVNSNDSSKLFLCNCFSLGKGTLASVYGRVSNEALVLDVFTKYFKYVAAYFLSLCNS